MLTWLLYVQFTPSTFSLIITYLNQLNFDFYIFQLHLKLLLMLIKSEESLSVTLSSQTGFIVTHLRRKYWDSLTAQQQL